MLDQYSHLPSAEIKREYIFRRGDYGEIDEVHDDGLGLYFREADTWEFWEWGEIANADEIKQMLNKDPSP